MRVPSSFNLLQLAAASTISVTKWEQQIFFIIIIIFAIRMWPNDVPKHSHCFPSEATESLITSQDPAILSKQSSSHQKSPYEAEIKYFFLE